MSLHETDLHVYARYFVCRAFFFECAGGDDCALLLRLDLGCGTGALGRWLSTGAGGAVDGVTLSDVEADAARGCYRKVVVGNLEDLDLELAFELGGYDYVVCADVLEHLKHPERVLEACHKLWKPTGRVLISIPNAAYAGLVAELMCGQFNYRERSAGQDPFAFFTRATLLNFLKEAGWLVEATETMNGSCRTRSSSWRLICCRLR